MSYRPATVQGAKYRKDWESTSRLDPDSVTVGGGAWPGHTPAHQVPLVWRAPEDPEGTGGRARLRCPWAVAGPGRASRRRAERSSRRGRLAGGPPPTGTLSSPAHAQPSRAWNTSGTTENVSRETSAQPPAPLPRMARKVAHLTYTVLCNFMQRMACLDSAFDQRRHPGLVRAHARAGKPPRPLVRRLRGPRTQPARIRDSSSVLGRVAPRGRLPRWRHAEPEGPAPR